MTNNRIYNGIVRRMRILGELFSENCIFISQHKDSDEEHATTIVQILDKDAENGEDYLALRRMLQAFAYRVNKETDLELTFKLKRKAKR